MDREIDAFRPNAWSLPARCCRTLVKAETQGIQRGGKKKEDLPHLQPAGYVGQFANPP